MSDLETRMLANRHGLTKRSGISEMVERMEHAEEITQLKERIAELETAIAIHCREHVDLERELPDIDPAEIKDADVIAWFIEGNSNE